MSALVAMKYSVLFPYLSTPDGGMELKYALRSLKNIKNFDGTVYVAGNKEDWFSDNIIHIRSGRIYHSPQADMEAKVMAALSYPDFPEDYLFMNDDIYITSPVTVKAYHKGLLTGSTSNYYQRAKKQTLDFLKENGIDQPLDYSIHVPMIMNKSKRIEVNKIIKHTFRGIPLQARNIYGNLFIDPKEAVYYEDKKTKTAELKQGVFISTQYYTSELDKLFPEPSIYERLET